MNYHHATRLISLWAGETFYADEQTNKPDTVGKVKNPFTFGLAMTPSKFAQEAHRHSHRHEKAERKIEAQKEEEKKAVATRINNCYDEVGLL